MNSESQLVLQLCRFLDPDTDSIRTLMENEPAWGYVLGQLLYHRMGSVAYHTLCHLDPPGVSNREVRSILEAISLSDHEKANNMEQCLELLGDVLSPAEFPYALLKGSYLLYLYPRGLRTSNDIDILIQPDDVARLERRLKAAGFEQGYLRQGTFVPAARSEIVTARMNRGETVPFIRRVDLPHKPYMEVDINFSLDFKATQQSDTVAVLLKNVQPMIPCRHTHLYTLEPIDFLIHLCAHLFKEATTYTWVAWGRDLSLYKFTDLYLLLRRQFDTAARCEELSRRIVLYGMQKECYYALYYTAFLFSLRADCWDKLLLTIRPDDTAYLKEIYRPDNRTTYRYAPPFDEWLFAGHKTAALQPLSSDTGQVH